STKLTWSVSQPAMGHPPHTFGAILRSDSAFTHLEGTNVFTKPDLRNAYQLMHICKGNKWKAAFNTPLGHFEYLVMPFSLTNAPKP
ncbi:hypothetical protein L3Q82_017183, partial [Scortum barcoo]